MFEFKTSIHAIADTQLYLYYIVLFIAYLVFLRNVKMNLLSILIFTLYNQGFLLLIDAQGRISKVLFAALVVSILFRSGNLKRGKRMNPILFSFLGFSALFYVNYLLSYVPLLWGVYQHYKYFVPVFLFWALISADFIERDLQYYIGLIVKLTWFQIAFSVVKLIIIGLRENITGSIGDSGGSIGISYAILPAILFWVAHNNTLRGKNWWFMFLVLLIPGASNKRAIWFLYPPLVYLMATHNITKQTLRKIAVTTLVFPLLVYVGFRLNPSLNPDRKLWGSFDLQYTIDYSLSYSGVSEEKLEGPYAQGRWGATMTIINNILRDPVSRDNMIGTPRNRTGSLEVEEFDYGAHGLVTGSMISGLGMLLLESGWPATLLLIIVFVGMIRFVPEHRIRFMFYALLAWNLILYSGTFMRGPTHSLLFVMTIVFTAKYLSLQQVNMDAKERLQIQAG